MEQGLNSVGSIDHDPVPVLGTIRLVSAKQNSPDAISASATASVLSTLNASGFRILSDPDQAIKSYIDLGIIDLRHRRLNDDQLERLKKISRRSVCGLLFLLGQETPPDQAIQLAQCGEVLFDNCGSPADIAGACKDMLRMRHIELEIRRRRRIADPHYIDQTPVLARQLIAEATQLPQILVAGEPSPHILSIVNQISQLGGITQCVYRPGQAIRALENGNFHAAVFLPRASGDPLNALARAMRRHQRFFTMPILHVSTVADIGDANTSTPDRVGRNIHVTKIVEQLTPIILSGLRRSTIMKSLVNTLNAENENPSALDKIAHPDAITANLESILSHADHFTQPTTFLSLQISMASRRTAILDETIEQIEKLISKSIRRSDVPILLNRNNGTINFAISLGIQSINSSTRIAGRLESLLRSSVFNNEQKIPLALSISSGIFHRPSQLCLEETVAGIIQNIAS